MAESRKTPERMPINAVDEGLDSSSPLKRLPRPVAADNAEEVAQHTIPTALRGISADAMWGLLGKTKKDMEDAFLKLKLPTMATTKIKEVKEVKGSNKYTQYVLYLNNLSDIVREELNKHSGEPEPSKVIRFFDSHHKPPKDHPTGTANCPDFVAMKLPKDGPHPSEFQWSALEATGELLSGSDRENSRAKNAAYTSFLLQARPDMVRVQGIYVDEKHFRLVVSDACGASDTEPLEWELRPSRLLLCAWIWRLYQPVLDPSITVNVKRDEPITFNIKVQHAESYPNCTILSAGTAFGRRTIVFECPERKMIIKEQYIETSRRFGEASILAKIHKSGTFPGVVRPGWYGAIPQSGNELIVSWKESRRKKTRLELLDKAPSIMDAKTLRDALVAMYDLLESEFFGRDHGASLIPQQVTRFLYKKCKILHRDISYNNVRLRDVEPPTQSPADSDPPAPLLPANTSVDGPLLAAVPAKQPIARELEEMCFASYLLRTKSNSSPDKLDTRVVVIDFDMGEDEEPSNQREDKGNQREDKDNQREDKEPADRTGTPTFVARTVVSARQKKGDYTLKPMPQLDQATEAYAAYKDAVPDRLKTFPPNKQEHYEIASDMWLNPFKHKLQYDAESVFWLLLWWAIQACPQDQSLDDQKIDERHWATLREKQDEKHDLRDRFVDVKGSLNDVLHSFYKPLEALLEAMAEQLRGDHEKGEDELRKQPGHQKDQSRKQPDYLHETFQRLIINFLFANYDENFMTTQKWADPRKIPEVAQSAPVKSSNQIARTRASSSLYSRNVEPAPSYSLRSAPRSTPSSGSRKRKGSIKGATSSDTSDNDANDEEYIDPASKRRKL